MNNLQKLGRLYKYFASCDWDHNNNDLSIRAADNGFILEIEFDFYNDAQLQINFDYKFHDDDFSIEWKDKWTLHCFTWDYEKIDELLGKIFSEVIKTDIEKLPVDSKINSDLRFSK